MPIESVNTTSMQMESTRVICKKIKHYLRYENKVNENKILSYCETLSYMQKHN